MGPTDRAVIERIRGGEIDAFSILVSRYYDRYAPFALRMLGDAQDAEEVLQDAFVRAYRYLDGYSEAEEFGPWLFRILVNRCRTALVRRRVRERVIAPLPPPVDYAGPDRVAAADGWHEEIERALATLLPEQREAFLLRKVEGLSYDEMAELTGSTVPALKMRVHRASLRLREMLEEVARAG